MAPPKKVKPRLYGTPPTAKGKVGYKPPTVRSTAAPIDPTKPGTAFKVKSRGTSLRAGQRKPASFNKSDWRL